MSYNGAGVFSITTAGQPVVTGTVISSTAFNALTADLATGLSTAITKDGQTTTTARILFAQGISSTLVTDATSATTGSIITAGGISSQKALWIGTTSQLVGLVTANGGVKVSASSATTDSFTNTDTNTGGKEWRFGATTSAGNWSVYNATDAVFGLKIANSGTVTIPGALIISGQLYAAAAFGSQLASGKTTNNGASTIFKVPYSSQCYTQYRVRVFCSNNTVQPNYSYQSTEYSIVVADSSGSNVTTITTIFSNQQSINGAVLNLTFALTSTTAAGFTTFTTTVSITGAAGATGAYTYYQVIPMGSEQATLPTAL